MTEAETLNQIALNKELLYSLMQWWLSVTIGLLALAHFFANRLNLWLLILLIGAYLVYSAFVTNECGYLLSQHDLLVEHLEDISNDVGVSAAGRGVIESNQVGRGVLPAMGVVLVLLQIASLVYLVFRYILSRREERAGAA